jgi:hypothetical protein
MKPLREAVGLLEKVSPIRRSECDRRKRSKVVGGCLKGFKYSNRRQDCGAPDTFHKVDFGGAPHKLAKMQNEFLLDCNISGAQTLVLSIVKGKEQSP